VLTRMAGGLAPIAAHERFPFSGCATRVRDSGIGTAGRRGPGAEPARRYSNQVTVARIAYSATSDQPSNSAAAPSIVICHTAMAMIARAPM
jgi:hypothetical protein